MSMPRRVRIVATLGPATDRPGVLAAICRAGLDVARINLSHGTSEEAVGRVSALRAAAQSSGRTIAVLADLPGPKLRVVLNNPRVLNVGERIVFATNPAAGEFGVTEPQLFASVRAGHRILLDDGRLQLRAESASESRVEASVVVGGTLSPKKGINLPDSTLAIPSITPGDFAALRIAAQIGADWLALSFVRSADSADELRQAAKTVGLEVPILAKIERPEAIGKLHHIVARFDGVMVARGDLGVEIPLEQVPVLQKRVIAEARAQGKPVITATDMLDSMRNNPRPTRAEASDVANSVYDGTDAVMLSGETAVGQFPVEAVECMDRIVRQAEADLGTHQVEGFSIYSSLDDEVAATVCQLAEAADANALIVPTLTGRTARLVARHRPRAAIVAPVPNEAVRKQLALVWGVTSVALQAHLPKGADRIDAAVHAAFMAGAIQTGQRILVMAGHPIEGGQRLPSMRLIKVGDQGASTEP